MFKFNERINWQPVRDDAGEVDDLTFGAAQSLPLLSSQFGLSIETTLIGN